MSTSTPEYDAFGPWVLPVSSHDQVPPVFRGHPVDFTRTHDVLKVPRTVVRRDVTPRSHLYDHLLVRDRGAVEVLTRVGHRYAVQRVEQAALLMVEVGTELLDGRLRVLDVDGGRIDVPFNGASLPVVAAFADRVVRPEPEDAAGGSSPLPWNALGLHDIGLVSAYNAFAADRPGLRVLTAHPGRPVEDARSGIRRLVHGVPQLSGAVVAADDADLVVLTRRDWVRTSRRPDHSGRRLTIRTGVVTSAAAAPDPTLPGVERVRLQAAAATVELLVPAGHGAAVLALLAEGIRPTG